MKIESITIVFEDKDHTDETKELSVFSRRIVAEFKNGEWSIDGPVYSRILLALHEVWQRLRQEVKNG